MTPQQTVYEPPPCPPTTSQPETTVKPDLPPRADLPPDLANLTDEQISSLTQEITDSYTKDVPLVGPFLPISVLVDEFQNNEPFLRKIHGLADQWGGFRRTARNGNCFYQAFAYAWIDNLQRMGETRIKEEIAKLEKSAQTLEAAGMLHITIINVGFEKLAYEDFLEAALTLLQSLPLGQTPSLAETLK
jgi:ubiquitin thioesterase protein OTUB1